MSALHSLGNHGQHNVREPNINRYPSNVLSSSNCTAKVSLADHKESPLPADTLLGPEKVSPHSTLDDTTGTDDLQPFDLIVFRTLPSLPPY